MKTLASLSQRYFTTLLAIDIIILLFIQLIFYIFFIFLFTGK